MRCSSFQLETKMAYRTLADNHISARQVDVGIKNKFKWCWLDETETLPGGNSIKLGGCPFNGPLSGMKYPTRTKSMTRRCIVVRSRSRSCGGGDPA